MTEIQLEQSAIPEQIAEFTAAAPVPTVMPTHDQLTQVFGLMRAAGWTVRAEYRGDETAAPE